MSTTLDFAGSLLIVAVADGQALARTEMSLKAPSPEWLAMRLEQLGVDVVICGAISRCLSRHLEMRGIQVVSFVSGDVDEVLRAYASGTLGDHRFLMAGCRPGAQRAGQCRRRRGKPQRP